MTFTATVSGSGGTPTGTVVFYDGANDLGSGTLNGSGQATLGDSSLSVSGSPHSITAVYGGDSSLCRQRFQRATADRDQQQLWHQHFRQPFGKLAI